MTALQGLRVVELGTFVAAAYCTKLLGDLGADVVKVEPPSGDVIRKVGPFSGTHDADASSGTQIYFDAGKRLVVADLHDPAGRETVERLISDADVFVTNLRPDRLRSLGLDGPSVRERHPDLVIATISPFGSWGDYSGWVAYGLNAEATGGGCTIGDPAREPLRHPWNQTDIQGGAHAAACILAGLYGQIGTWIDIAEADIWSYHVPGGAINTWVFHGRARRRNGRRTPNPYPAGAFDCKDGLVNELAIRGGEWKRFLLVLGDGTIPEWSQDPRYRDRRRNSIEYADELDELQRPWLMAHTREEIFSIARANRLPFAPVYRLDEVVQNVHLNTRDFFVDLPRPAGGSVRAPGAPYKLSRTPARLPGPAPRLTDGLAAEPWPARSPRRSEPKPQADGLPLSGVRVLDLTAVIAGPQASRMLADLGAEVVKIESRAHPDAMRTSENNVDGNPEHDSQFHFMNRNKRGITLNIATLRGRALFKQLAAMADVVIENFSPRMMPERGLDYRTLSQLNPRLVMVSMPGAGDTGPLRDMLSYAPGVNAVSGFDSVAGYPNEAPVTVAGAYCDWNSAIHAVVATLAALHERRRSGAGQYINLSQWETAVASLGPALMSYTLGGVVPGPIGNQDPYYAPHGIYPTSEVDKWVAIVCGTDEEWVRLRHAMDDPAWAGVAHFDRGADRVEHVEELEKNLAAWTAAHTREALTAHLQACGVACSPLLELGERFGDPHFRARDGFVDVEHPTMGLIVLGGVPWKFDNLVLPVNGHGPLLGQDNHLVFGEWLGVDAAEIADLEDSRVIY